MSKDVLNHIMFISVVLAFSAFTIILAGFIMNFLFKRAEKFLNKLAKKISPKLHKKYSIIYLEGSYFLLVALWSIIIVAFIKDGKLSDIIFLFISVIFVNFSAILLLAIRNDNTEALSFGMPVQQYRSKKSSSFLLNQLKLLLDSLTDMVTIILYPLIVFIYLLFQILKWPDEGYFFLLIVLPVFLGLWIYFGINKKADGSTAFLNDQNTKNFRRVVLYSVLLVIAFKCSFNSYLISLDLNTDYDLKYTTVFLNTYSAIFIACDRLLKAWTDNYNAYNKNEEDIKPSIAQPPS
ncbi:MAG: hypothetical protein K0R50_3516 [Eubacterium sp.]|nr:hypothetical protein [Eubacterium sp.]